jgi:tRNA A37 threonylcarbamoyladenosine biosynthesis protein TsaE
MENGMTMGDCLRTNKLIILRGNSGSGKTTIAKELQQVFGGFLSKGRSTSLFMQTKQSVP